MKVAVFSTKAYDLKFFAEANRDHHHELLFFEAKLTEKTAELARGCEAVCPFVNDHLGEPVLKLLADRGVKLLALRTAGFNHVNLPAAGRLGFSIVRVPAYSPYAVAEHTVGLMLTLNRKIHRAYNRVREANFSLEGLIGFDFRGRTVGIFGTGKIGAGVARILTGFGCRVIAYDRAPNPECVAIGVEYTSMDELLAASDIITLHCPLVPATRHLINSQRIAQMRDGVMLINTSRGGLIETGALLPALKSGKIGYLGLDVYEEEDALFFEDLSSQVIQDDVFMRLVTFPNVIITGHQAFFTREAMRNIAETTLSNITDIEQGRPCPNRIEAERRTP